MIRISIDFLERKYIMNNILLAVKLFFLGILIEITRKILNMSLKINRNYSPYSSPINILLSRMCNQISGNFIKLEYKIKNR